MKRLTACLLALLLCLSLLAGCGEKKTQQDPASTGSGAAPDTTEPAPDTETVPPETETDPPETEPAAPAPVTEEEHAAFSRLLTYFAEQNVYAEDILLEDEYALVSFAHIYASIHEFDATTYQSVNNDFFETMTLEKMNDILTRLLGTTVSPAEGTDYTALRGENYATHESYHDGAFWWPAAGGEMHLRFAVADAPARQEDGTLETDFTVYNVDLDVWPGYTPDALPTLPAQADVLEQAGCIREVGFGTAEARPYGDGLQIVSYAYADLPTMPDDWS